MRACTWCQAKFEATYSKGRPGTERKGEAGQALALVALGMVVLLGFVGLGVDVGQLRYMTRRVQSAADSSAIAGAQEVLYGDVSTASKADSAANGFTNGAGGATVTVNNPPLSGPHSGSSGYVEVIVSEIQPTFFMKIFGISSSTVSARAVATQTSGPACVYALDPTASNAYVASGSGTLNVQCGVVVDSNNSKAFVDSGGACTDATSIGIVGGIGQDNCSVPASPRTGIIPVSNPLAYLNSETPTVGTCTQTNYTLSGGGGSATIGPGVYCKGITVQGGATLTLTSGVYILNGGGLTVSGGSSAVGSGVMFYNTATSGYQFDPIVVSGTSTTSLTAPTTGTYAGILFFQDPTMTSSSMNTISGTSSTVYQGAMYFPTTNLTYSGGSIAAAAYSIIVADTITISGNSYVGDNYSSLPGGVSPITNAVLVE